MSNGFFKTGLFFLLLISARLLLLGQFTHLIPKNGLSQNQVFGIIQDTNGFIWIGTLDGLNKYDGYTCKIYKRQPHQEHTLSDNNILSMCLDNSGFILLGTEGGGLNRLDPISEKVTCFRYNSSIKAGSSLYWCRYQHRVRHL